MFSVIENDNNQHHSHQSDHNQPNQTQLQPQSQQKDKNQNHEQLDLSDHVNQDKKSSQLQQPESELVNEQDTHLKFGDGSCGGALKRGGNSVIEVAHRQRHHIQKRLQQSPPRKKTGPESENKQLVEHLQSGGKKSVNEFPSSQTGGVVVSCLNAQVEVGHAQNSSHSPPVIERESTSVMPPFMVSAPGKVIVYGEHAVVHKQGAIAASISLRSYLLVQFPSSPNKTVTLRFPDIGLLHSWDIESLPWSKFDAADKKKTYNDRVTELDLYLVQSLDSYVKQLVHKQDEAQTRTQQVSAKAFLYLFLSLGSRSLNGCVYTLRSTIPVRAGLGSSASISVCLSCALLLQTRALEGGVLPGRLMFDSPINVERINQWAFVAEMVIHGNPSGVDNSVSSGGKAIVFQRRDDQKSPVVQRLQNFPELPLLLVNTNQSRSTSEQVAKVQNMLNKYPRITGSILTSIGEITSTAHRLLTTTDFSNVDNKNKVVKSLGELASINHELLVSLKVSHPKLEKIREIIDQSGIGWTKLTGAGGGGCAIAFMKPLESEYDTSSGAAESEDAYAAKNGGDCGSTRVCQARGEIRATINGGDECMHERWKHTQHRTNSKITEQDEKRKGVQNCNDLKAMVPSGLARQMKEQGFDLFTTTLAGNGVGLLWPAIGYSRGADGKFNQVEIDPDQFQNEQDHDRLQNLVGMGEAVDSSINRINNEEDHQSQQHQCGHCEAHEHTRIWDWKYWQS